MVLKNDFYKVKESSVAENKISAVIELNVMHDIYKGHFPQQPIVPGVCQIHIIKEFLEGALDKKLVMTNGDNIKFTGMIIPDQNPVINIELNYLEKDNMIVAEAKLFSDEITFTKYKGRFKVV